MSDTKTMGHRRPSEPMRRPDPLKMGEDARLSRLLDGVLGRALIAIKYNGGVEPWSRWARRWLDGDDRTPGSAVDAAHQIGHDSPFTHALHQLAWAAKEACYGATHKPAHWYVLRYVADAAIALNIDHNGLVLPHEGDSLLVDGATKRLSEGR